MAKSEIPVLQVCLSPLNDDIIRYIRELNYSKDNKISRSRIASKIIASHFAIESNVPKGFKEWLEKQSKD